MTPVSKTVRRLRRLAPGLWCALACFALPAPGRAADEPPAPKPVTLSVEKLDETLYRISGSEAGGVMVLVGEKGLLLVDSEDATHAAVFDSVLRTVSPLPVKTIVNTHYHYDHVGGNERYKAEGATVIAQANMWAQAVKDTVIADWGNWHRKPAVAGAEPTTTFSDSMRIDFEGDPVVLVHVPAAHTDDDVMTWFPKHDVLHTGDVVEIGAPPFVDLWAGGSVDGMIAAVDRYLALSGEGTRVVPGHGSIITKAGLGEYRTMIATVADLARKAIADGQDLKPFLESQPAAPFESRLGSARGARNLAALFYFGLNGMKEEAKGPADE